MKVTVDLDGVPETALLTLYCRAAEARRPDALLADPMAVGLVDAIDYPFGERFAHTWHGGVVRHGVVARALCFDAAVRRFLAEHPGGTVVALGEGFETEFWRVDNGSVRWLTVDLPRTVELRRGLLPEDPRVRLVGASALDASWLDEVDPADGVLVTAQGLLMYLQPAQVYHLIASCAGRLPGGAMLFDTLPHWWGPLAAPRAYRGFRLPPMPWALDVDEQPRLRALHPNVASVEDLELPAGRGPVYGPLRRVMLRGPVVRNHRPAVVLLRFGAAAA